MLRLSVLSAMAVAICGCGSIIKGSDQTIPINTTPDGASIRILDESRNTVFSGLSPAAVTLPKKSGYFDGMSYTIEVEKEGFQSTTVLLQNTTHGWYIGGNIVVGGIIGWFIVDPLTGGMWKLEPEQVNVFLDQNPLAGEVEDEDGFRIATLEDVPDALRDDLVPVVGRGTAMAPAR